MRQFTVVLEHETVKNHMISLLVKYSGKLAEIGQFTLVLLGVGAEIAGSEREAWLRFAAGAALLQQRFVLLNFISATTTNNLTCYIPILKSRI